MKIRIRSICYLLTCAFFFNIAQANQQGYVFSPGDSEFSVTFPKVPVVEVVHMLGSQFERASLMFPEQGAFFRAEAMFFDAPDGFKLPESEVVEQLYAYAEANGLLHPEITVRDDHIGLCGILRAYKKLSGTNYTYNNMMCYGRHTVLMLYVGSVSEHFPPKGGVEFLGSLSRVE